MVSLSVNTEQDHHMNWADIRGWSKDCDRQFMYDRIVEYDAKTILEIGIYAGRMTVALAAAATLTKGLVHSVDPWLEMADGAVVAREFLDTYTKFNLQDTVKIHAETSTDFAARYRGRIDLAWIDGGHTYACVLDDLKAWFGRSSVLYGHDWHIDGVREAAIEYARIWNSKDASVLGAVVDYATTFTITPYKIEGTDNIWTFARN
jgi:predicted O-methyltransferase YrrM